ncbi:MAG: hypothetical protein MZU91_04565 [Desulfosudis oleivorans]|nr:hypothetical protein [Desulfosudis oleivorans]
MLEAPGSVVGPAPKGLKIAAGGGYVYLKDVQLESKKRLPITDFLRGFRFTPGSSAGVEKQRKKVRLCRAAP